MHICLFLHCQCLLDLGNDAVGVDAVGVEHQRGLAAAAKLVVDAVADDGHRIILAQIFGDCRAKTAEDMKTAYGFTAYQISALDELLADRAALSSLAGSLAITNADVREVLAALPADLEQARRDTVQTALQLVGKVNYF